MINVSDIPHFYSGYTPAWVQITIKPITGENSVLLLSYFANTIMPIVGARYNFTYHYQMLIINTNVGGIKNIKVKIIDKFIRY